MIVGEVVLGAREWLGWAGPLAAAALVVLAWSYGRFGGRVGVRLLAGLLKATGIVALAICLIEPLFSGTRPRPKANLFLLVADNSRSLQIRDRTGGPSRGQDLQQRLSPQMPWRTRLEQDFDVRSYSFDARFESVKDFDSLKFDGDASAIDGTIVSLADRFAGRPIGGILLFTDGNATDVGPDTSWQNLPPVYPVTIGDDAGLPDVTVSRVSVSQTNFEAAPVTIAAEVECRGLGGKAVSVRVLDDSQKVVEHRTAQQVVDDKPLIERFELKPERPGISFYTVQAAIEGEEKLAEAPEKSAEATLINNRRLALVDRGGGPYRVLYVSGRPNWEFKFLRRALTEDEEVSLVALVRIAKKEPKFTFRGRPGERTNPLFRGFGNQNDEQAEQYDEPVLIRLGTEDKEELKGGFPKAAEDLFRYHALIVDDVESEFFTHEQMSLIQRFVSQRGGGFLMLGGHNSFANGRYQRTPVGELLPVYLDRGQTAVMAESYRLQLTRDGWLQPWVRLRSTEDEEHKRLAAMPSFLSVSYAGTVKPGAAVLASVQATDGQTVPALVAQQFGRGRAAAMAIGDLWRWNLKRQEGAESDLEKAWRQTVRWLVADVPQQVEVETQRVGDDPGLPVRISVRVRDKLFEPLDNATVTLRVKTPEGREIELTAESSEHAAGQYETSFASRTAGAYRATVVARAEDASEVGQREAGWTVEPAADELRQLKPNRELLARLAQATGGEVIAADGLDHFVGSLPNRKIPVTEAWTYPLWHQWPVFLFAIACLVGEWGLRRWNGLP
ncbi:MAG TPA: glutamine amidotransferase [Pirellulales bacterium]|jgi:uncharacterized membrane protein|nr:glutamine amidotransferase [Pirellulales bacterium]